MTVHVSAGKRTFLQMSMQSVRKLCTLYHSVACMQHFKHVEHVDLLLCPIAMINDV